jgi:prophage tail gpP-like protein
MPESVAVQHADGRRFGEWSEIDLHLGIDSYRGASLSGPWDPDREEMRAAFQPLSFPEVTITIGDELFLTGKAQDVAPSVDATQASVGVTVYSSPYWLEQICAPPEILPLEFNGLDLKAIATKIAGGALGIPVKLEGKAGAKFERVRCEPDEALHGFLAELALQRGFVVSDTAAGELLFRSEGATGSPVARLEGQPVGKVTAQFQPERWFSHITGRANKRAGTQGGSKFTQKNSLYRGSQPRHHCSSVGDTGSADVPRAAKAQVGRMVASAATYTVEDLPTWRDPSGKLWTPNTTLALTAPGAMIYSETELLIRSVKLKQRGVEESATLELVLPGSFGGALPKKLPWDS